MSVKLKSTVTLVLLKAGGTRVEQGRAAFMQDFDKYCTTHSIKAHVGASNFKHEAEF